MVVFEEKDFLACCGSSRFAKEMILAGPFNNYIQSVDPARDIWFNKVDVNGWLEAFAAHPRIGESASQKSTSPTSANWSKGEQSRALATATESSLKELIEWNASYYQKFGFVFLICASGRSTPEILAELKRRYTNRPIVEFEIAAQEQMKITELRLAKLFSTDAEVAFGGRKECSTDMVTRAGEDRMNVVSAHLSASTEASVAKPSQTPARTRPPITTHVLDTARGCPAAGIEVHLEAWEGMELGSVISEAQNGRWIVQGSSVTDKDGRSGQLIHMIDALNPGLYRISFSTGTYNPDGFFPYVSIVFKVKESQKFEHFHVPLLLSPFSFSTYRGS